MENKLFDSNCITLDGKMDEAVWNEVETHGDFRYFQSHGGQLQEVKTFFKIIPCADRIYVGVKCMEPDMKLAESHRFAHSGYGKPSIQLFFCPSGKDFDFYQFFAGWDGSKLEFFYSECGQIQPDPYAPEWRFESYSGDTYWSMEFEIPLTAFYMTPDDQWSDTWLMNVARVHFVPKFAYSTWAPTLRSFVEPKQYLPLSGFPIRPKEDDVYTSKISVELEERTAEGLRGKMDVEIRAAVAGDFIFKTDHTEPFAVSLNAGVNEFTLPCFFAETGRTSVEISLIRTSDEKAFNRWYEIRAQYEPLVVKMTLPEYRNNFYPGQDYSKVVGKVITKKPATVTLEGPGIETQTVTPDAEGNFQFDTSNFEIGDAYLTATIDECSVKKKIRRLAPIEGTMTWVSGGNIICNGKPVLPRKMYGPLWRGGTVFGERYQREEQYNTEDKFKRQHFYHMGPNSLIRGSEASGGEALEDRMPSDEMLRKLDEVIEANKGKDFAFYYLSDEPDLRRLSPIYLKNYYEYVAEKDPYHICMMCFKRPEAYVECCDWLQTHPYIQPYINPDGSRTYGEPVHLVGTHLDGIVQMNRADKCMGFLPTCYAYKKHSKHYDYPTFDELVTHTWAAMIHGGKSLWPYAYHGMNDRACMYQGIRYLFSSFEALEDIVLFGKRTTLQRSEQTEAVLYTHGDVKMFVLVNFTQQEQTVTLDGIEGTSWYHFRHNGMQEGNTFTLKPSGTIIGTSVPKGESLPLYDDVLALVEREEYARTHTGSLLFDRHDEIVVTSSSTHYPDLPKLFDGVRDNLGYELHLKEDQTENYFEMDLTKVAPSFNKVAVHGLNVDGMTIQLGNGEELTDPEVIDVITEQYSTTIVLKDTVKPERLRLIFPHKIVELYEIEVF